MHNNCTGLLKVLSLQSGYTYIKSNFKYTILLKVAQQLLAGLDPRNAAASCAEILSGTGLNAPSGYYWLRSDNGSAVHVFCDMTLTCKGVGGGWMQVAKLNMTNSSHQCPPGTRIRTNLPRRVCETGLNTAGCSSTTFAIYGIQYREICGKVIAYKYGTTDAFGTYNRNQHSYHVDGNYVDGISLTHGSNPRKHIWTFAAAFDEEGVYPAANCPCTNIYKSASATPPPSFVENDYFCDTGSTSPLWDGAGCGPANTCCTLNNPPWFLKQLPSNTTDDIEMRMCSDESPSNEGTRLEILELYIR